MLTCHTACMLTLAAVAAACGSSSSRAAGGADSSGTTSALEFGPRPGAAKDSAACWPMRVVRPPRSADSAMAIRPAPHADSAMAVRPVCPPAG
jgi:hypothetical protein